MQDEAEVSFAEVPIQASNPETVSVVTWNVAAVNNNPFEYWVSNPNPAYNALIMGVQRFFDDTNCDVPICNIFTSKMFLELLDEIRILGIPGHEELQILWAEDYSKRMAVSQFLNDPKIGSKRLVSMPDRVTNTIEVDGQPSIKRPTAINSYDGGSLASIEEWWAQWRKFMFHTHVPSIVTNSSCPDDHSAHAAPLVYKLLGPISRAKYPAVSEAEQRISVALQLLCLAIFDAAYIFILRSVDPAWEQVRRQVCAALILNKPARVHAILTRSHLDADVVFLQEAASTFAAAARAARPLGERFAVFAPRDADSARNQNSLILVARRRFLPATAAEVTDHITAALHPDGGDCGRGLIAPGDFLG